jgi:DNA modification methylase
MGLSQIVFNGNNIDLLKNYPDNHFDSIVTDPPYGLGKEPNAEELMKDWIEKGYHEISGSGFMGKEWDSFVPQPIFWKEVYRVLKPGGHLLAFYGTRTYDWGVMAMRFAGFEVRDCIQWLYGSGFPKSHNISKALDKMPKANSRLLEFAELLKDKRNELGLTIAEADDLICNGSTMYNFLEGRNINGVCKIYPPNRDFYEKIIINYKIEGWDDIIENNLQVVGSEEGNFGFQSDGERWTEKREIKEFTTNTAKKWDGWGTALKPANEPIVLARKPLEKGLSIAENILKWGVGGINIDASRIGTEDKTQRTNNGVEWGNRKDEYYENREKEVFGSSLGRFPANIILTHSSLCQLKGTKKVKGQKDKPTNRKKFEGTWNEGNTGLRSNTNSSKEGFADENGQEEVENWDCHEDCPIRILDEQSIAMGMHSAGSKKDIGDYNRKDNNSIFNNSKGGIGQKEFGGKRIGDKGGASRFFYVAKASKAERNKGLEDFEEKPLAFSNQAKAELKRGNLEFNGNGITGEGIVGQGNKVNMLKNFHPTVKPIKLMQYLIKMITPPNGIVLDPFCGSGTTGVACKLDGFNFVGLEQDPEYTKIAEARIDNTKVETEKQMKLWD